MFFLERGRDSMKKKWKRITASVMAGTLMLSEAMFYPNGSWKVYAEETNDAVEGISIETLFEDTALQEYMAKSVDLNGNGKLSTTEIGAVKGLNVDGLGIKSMNGIENFVNLEVLQCNDNQISKLDLSSNKKLTGLYCKNNKLVTLNVSSNLELKIIDCSDNMLGELAIENCGFLKELYCRNNLIGSGSNSVSNSVPDSGLNIAFAAQLTILDCGQNNINTLDLSGNGLLKELYCDGAYITSLDFRNNPNLETINCEGNILTSVNLSANNNLKVLDCSDNQLEVLDLSNIERLQQVDCSNNQIKEINVKKSTGLTGLDCRNNKIQNLNLTANTMLSSLACSNNELLHLDISNNKNLATFLCENSERTIGSPVLYLSELSDFEEEKVSELTNATIVDGMLRFVNTSLPVTYKYQVAEGTLILFTLYTTGTFKSMATVNVENIAEQTYCGQEIKPEIKAVYGSDALEEGKHFTVTYTSNTDAGTAMVTLQGKGEYDGTIKETFKINQADITTTTIADIRNQVYSGQAITPDLDITFEGMSLVYGKDYTANYSNNYEIGEATVEIIGKGNFKGSITKNFTIEEKHIGRAAMRTIDNQIYNGMEIQPEVVVEDGSTVLKQGQDYTYVYQDNINAGTAKIIITGHGNYGKTSEETFIIEPKPINNLQVEEISDRDYNGFEQKPAISVYDKDLDTALIENEDYVVTYEDNINAGTATVMIYGKGNYKGQIEKNFTIRVRDSENVKVETIASQVYTAREIKPNIIIKDGDYQLIQGTDYTVAYTENQNVGTAGVELIFQGNYQGIVKTQFEIVPRDVEYVDVSKIPNQYYAAAAIEPEFTLRHDNTILVKDKDYLVEFEENVEIGIGKIYITGIGNYSGSEVVEFSIVQRPIEKTDKFCNEVFTYTGQENQPKPTLLLNEVELKEGVDYEISYENNVDAGTGSIVVKGIGNFCDKATVEFKILPRELHDVILSATQAQIYTGAELKPDIQAAYGEQSLKNGTDYSLTYENNINVGTAGITVTGMGNYTGEVKISFKIQPKSITETTVGIIKAKTYTGTAVKPGITVKDGTKVLAVGKDYKVKYSKNKSVGTASVEVIGTGNYTGSQKTTFEIKPAAIKNATVTMAESVTYTGKAVKPKVKVSFGNKKLKSGKDYTVTYTKNTAIGKASVVLQGKGNFKGKKTISFDIGVKAPKISKVSSKSNKLKVEWSASTEATGYEIQYSTDKTFQSKVKKKTIAKASKVSFQSGKLKKGNKYYVRIRSYTKVSGKKVYGGYSAVKSVKIK